MGLYIKNKRTYCNLGVGLLQLVVPCQQYFGGSTNKTVNVFVILEYVLVRNALKAIILVRLESQ